MKEVNLPVNLQFAASPQSGAQSPQASSGSRHLMTRNMSDMLYIRIPPTSEACSSSSSPWFCSLITSCMHTRKLLHRRAAGTIMNTAPTTLRKKPRTISVRKTGRQRNRVKMGGKRGRKRTYTQTI